MLARALRAGVTIACGSDAGVFAHGDNAREIELMVEYGMSAADALRAATAVAARVIDRDADLGRIAAGAVADLVLVRGDPLRDPSALRNPALVLKDGRIAIDRRDQPILPVSPAPDSYR
jgi:imidazolonepropionase-like amidohydrolase